METSNEKLWVAFSLCEQQVVGKKYQPSNILNEKIKIKMCTNSTVFFYHFVYYANDLAFFM
jgi:hypothetical protein